ncbi:MAG: phosphohydrolase [Candidatus Hodarchaeota archaeon]
MSVCPGITNFIRPKPEFIACPICRSEVEIWTDEIEAECMNCGTKVSRNMQSCLDWCEYADKCKEIIAQKRRGAA